MSNITLSSNTTSISLNTSTDTISVSSTPTSITVGAAQTVSNTAIRAAIGNTFPIQYDVSTGIISSGVSNVFPILYDVSTGVISIDEDAIVDETVVNNGQLSGNITLDLNSGRLHKVTLNGDITGITFANIATGRSATIILTQDSLGGNQLDTTTYTSNWTAWNFSNQFTTLDLSPSAWNVLSVFYDGVNYYASLVVEQALQIQNSELANSNITVNGTTINLGGSGQISNLTGLDTGDLTEGSNQYFTTARSRNVLSVTTNSPSGNGSLSYNNVSGVFTFTPADAVHLTNAQVQTYIQNNGLNGSGDVTMTGTATFGNSATQTHTFTGNVEVTGNIEVAGNLNYRNVEDLYVRDQSITLNANAISDATVSIIANRPVAGANTVIRWNETSDIWEFTNDGSTYYPIPTSTSDLAEGTNLYYTDARVEAYLSGNTSTINADTIQANAFIGGTFTGEGSDLTDVRAESVEVTLKNVSAGTITKGYPVHATGYSGSGEVECVLADAGNTALMPAHFIAQETMLSGATGRGILAGRIQNVDTSSFSVGDTIYVAVGGGYANVAPTGEANVIQNLGVVTRIDASVGGGEVLGAGRSAATPNLNNGNIFLGNGSNQAVPAVLDTSIVPENTNLYYTDARANSAFDARLIDTGVQKKAHTVFVQDLALSPDAANAQLGFYMPNGQGTAGQVLKFDSATQVTQAFLDTANVTETSNLWYTDARVQSNTAADTGLVHTTGTETVDGIKSFTKQVIVAPDPATSFGDAKLLVGGDSATAEISFEEYSNFSGSALMRTLHARGTKASPIETRMDDQLFRFIAVGAREGNALTTGHTFGFDQDSGNVDGQVPTMAYFRNPVNKTTFAITGYDGVGSVWSDAYINKSFVGKENTVHATKTFVIGNTDPEQNTPTVANLTIGHSETSRTHGRTITNWYAAQNGIQKYLGLGVEVNLTQTGVEYLPANTVCVSLNGTPRFQADIKQTGGTTGLFSSVTWNGDYIADGTAVTVNGSPTGIAANTDAQTYYTRALCEFDAFGQSSISIYALYKDSALTQPLDWFTDLNAASLPGQDGNFERGWIDIQYEGGDYTKKIPTSQTTTSGSGTGAEFVVAKKGTTYKNVQSYYTPTGFAYYNRSYPALPIAKGSGYAVNDTVEIDGTHLGGTSGTHNLTFTIDSVDGSGGVTSVGNVSGTAYDPATSTWSLTKNYTDNNLTLAHNNTEKIQFTTTQTEFLTIPLLPKYSNISLPPASTQGGMIFVTNGNDKIAYSNGSAWLYVFDNSAVT